MKKKLITKIAASAASLTLVAGMAAAPADSFISKFTQNNAITASAWDYTSFLDSSGTFYIKLNSTSVENGVCRATEAQIYNVVSSKITKNSVFNIPSKVTVSGKNFNNVSFTVTVPVTEIGPSAFYNEKDLTSVSFPSSVKKIGYKAFSNSGLVSLDLPSTITGIASTAFENCDGLYNVNFKCSQPPITAFIDCDNLTSFNNVPILNYNPKTGEPILNSGVLNELYAIGSGYDTIKRCPFIQQYADEYINYIVRTNTNSSDSDIVKAKKLHDWLINHTEYDYDAMGSNNSAHEEWGPFFRRKNDGKFYAVCAGYAGAYKLLLNAADVDCYYVGGSPLTGTGGGHAWNVVKIDGNYYHVDATWDDSNREHYKYFLRSDEFFSSNHEYKWSGLIDDEIKNYQTGVAIYDMHDLADVNDDGEVTEDDALEIQKYLIKTQELSEEQLMRADINMDGEVKMNDAVSIYMALTKMKNDKYTKTLFEYIYIDGKMNV